MTFNMSLSFLVVQGSIIQNIINYSFPVEREEGISMDKITLLCRSAFKRVWKAFVSALRISGMLGVFEY